MEDIKLEKGSGNVFADIGLDEPEDRLAKADLASRLSRIVEKQNLSQGQAAELFGVTPQEVTAILKGELEAFSRETLELLLKSGERKVFVETEIRGSAKLELSPPIISAGGFQLEIAVVGNSIGRLKRLVHDFAKSGRKLLFVGEPGTGKELFSDIYAEASKREKRSLNCSAYDGNTAISVLFGHTKGAYTDAKAKRDGLFSEAEGGVVFLDELGAATRDLQAQLLRVLETEDYLPLGADKDKKLGNVLVCAATSDPDSVRQDLRDRFIILHVPSLRHRRGDIQAMIKHLLAKEAAAPEYISQEALNVLKKHSWPDNVRGLRNAMQIAVDLAAFDKSDTIITRHLPAITDKDQDRSKKVKISSLLDDGELIPRHKFFKPFDSGQQKNRYWACPKEYSDSFYDHFSLLGYRAKALNDEFPKAVRSSLQAGLDRARKRNP
ncbi:MAG: sigma 54-interacting transcriptional regulator [Deltaproteobacteria bacterium]|nr:sigma 54-interacting transcriptional regulator [Deltaproteobacteria bacterium]